MKITAKFLTDRDACNEQVQLFRKTFPRGATVNSANLHKASIAGLSLYWFTRKLYNGSEDPVPYQRIDRTKEARAFYRVDRQQDREMDALYSGVERQREAAYKQMSRNLCKLSVDRDLSPNEVKRLSKAERKNYLLTAKVLGKHESRQATVIRRKYRADLRKLRAAKELRTTEILIPIIMAAAASYDNEQ